VGGRLRARRRRLGSDRIEKLGSGEEDHAGAGRSQHPAGKSRILREIMLAAFDRADGDGIGDRPRLEARFNPEKPADLLSQRHSLTSQRADGGFDPFISYPTRLKSG